jgi:hypothetical protein
VKRARFPFFSILLCLSWSIPANTLAAPVTEFYLPAFHSNETETQKNRCAPISEAEFSELLGSFQKAIHSGDPTSERYQKNKWLHSERISDAVFCAARNSSYVSFLKKVQSLAIESSDSDAFLALAKDLQNEWETRYLLKLVSDQRRRMALASEGSQSLIVITLALGMFKQTQAVSMYFGLVRKLFPIVFPSVADLTAKALNESGLLDRKYPLSPAHVMTDLPLPTESQGYSAYDIFRDLSGATAATVGIRVASSVIDFLDVGATTIGGLGLNPVSIAAGIVIGETSQYLGEKTVDVLQLKLIENDLAREKEKINGSLANDDFNGVHAASSAFYKTVLKLSAFFDRATIDAWNSYQQGLLEAKTPHKIPFIYETSSGHARQVFSQKLARIAADRDSRAKQEVLTSMALHLLADDPNYWNIAQQDVRYVAQDLVDDYYEHHKDQNFSSYVESRIRSQEQRLASDFQEMSIFADSQGAILQAIAFLKSQKSRYLSSTINDLTHVFAGGEIAREARLGAQ